MHGLTSAVQCLCEPIPQNSKTNQTNSAGFKAGRIICITNLKSEAHVHTLVACVTDALRQQNSETGLSDRYVMLTETLDVI